MGAAVVLDGARLVYAVADWSPERAAGEMTRGKFRHAIVMDGSRMIRVLVVANRTAATPNLLAAVRDRAVAAP